MPSIRYQTTGQGLARETKARIRHQQILAHGDIKRAPNKKRHGGKRGISI